MRTSYRHRPARNRPDREAPLLILLAAVLLGIFLSMPGAQGSAPRESAGRAEQLLSVRAEPAHGVAEETRTDPLILPSRDAAVQQAPLRKRAETAPAPEPYATIAGPSPVRPWPASAAEPAGTSVPAAKMAGGIRTTGPPARVSRPA